MKDLRQVSPPLLLHIRFRQMHEGPGSPTLMREFHRTREELDRVRAGHAEWVRMTRKP